MSAVMLKVSLLAVGMVIRRQANAWLAVKCLEQVTNEYASSPPGP